MSVLISSGWGRHLLDSNICIYIHTIDILPKMEHPVDMLPKLKNLSISGEIFSLGSLSTEVSSSSKTSKRDMIVSPENATPPKIHQIEKLRLVGIYLAAQIEIEFWCNLNFVRNMSFWIWWNVGA